MVERDWSRIIHYRPYPSNSVLDQKVEGLEDFAYEASRSRTRVGTFSMAVEPELVVPIFEEAPLGLDKKVVFDAYTYLVSQGKILAIYEKIPGMKKWVEGEREKYQEMIQRLKAAGTKVEVQNHPKEWWERFFPFTNRLHRKGSYVDNIFYIQTGNHTTDPSADIMIKIVGLTAEYLISEFTKINSDPPTKDYFVEVADDMHLFVDAGKPGESIILNKALSLIDSAQKSVLNFSSLWPDGKIAKSLQQKHKEGKNVEVLSTKFYPEPGVFTVGNGLYLVNLAGYAAYVLQGYNFPVYPDPYRAIHVKGLIIDECIAFIGSNNLNSRVVRAGTKEWQILTTNPEIVAGLLRKFRDYKEVITAPYKLLQ